MSNQTVEIESKAMVLPAELTKMAQGVSVEKRNEVQSVLNKVFDGVAKMREQLDNIQVVDENDKVSMNLSNAIRLGVRVVRLDAEKTFDAKRSEVQQLMSSFKAEDALWLKSKQIMQILTKEIEENARWKEETTQRFNAEKAELKIQERILIVAKLNPDILRVEFESVSDAMFDSFVLSLAATKRALEEAAAQAEADRIAAIKAEADAKAAMEAENKRLKAEAEAKEKQMQAERLKADTERAEMEAREQKAKAEAEAALRVEREANDKLQAEIKAKADAEHKAQREASEAAERAIQAAAKAAKAPKQQKLKVWVDAFSIESPTGMDNDVLVIEILQKFESFKVWAKSKIEST